MQDIYINITAEGALLGKETLQTEEEAQNAYFQFRSNNTIVQARVVGYETIRHYHKTAEGQQWHEEPALIVAFGQLLGHIPLSESGMRHTASWPRIVGQYLACMPDRFHTAEGRTLYLFSRGRALEAMQKANLDKVRPGVTWTGVIRRRNNYGYLVDVGGFEAFLPLSHVSYDVNAPHVLQRGDMIDVKILQQDEGRKRTRLIVSRREAQANPYDVRKHQYTAGSIWSGTVRGMRGNVLYAYLHDGVLCRSVVAAERTVFRMGDKVLIRVHRCDDDQKLIVGSLVG